MRILQGKTQAEMAVILGCHQSAISTFERTSAKTVPWETYSKIQVWMREKCDGGMLDITDIDFGTLRKMGYDTIGTIPVEVV